MVQNQNSESVKAILSGANLQSLSDYPNEISKIISPVIDMTPRFHRKINVVEGVAQTATGTITAYTTSSTKEFNLVSLHASYIKDATCDISTGNIGIVCTPEEGVAKNLKNFSVITLTAQNENSDIIFNPPLRLKKNTAISMTGAFTLGVLSRSINIAGYEIIP